MTHLSPTTNPIATRVDDDDDHTIVVPPEDRTIVIPPRTPDDRLVTLPGGQRWWISLPSQIRALLPEGMLVMSAAAGRKPRKPTLASLARQANKAAIPVARYEVKPDGTVVVVTGKPEPVESENPWPLDEFRTKETKQ